MSEHSIRVRGARLHNLRDVFGLPCVVAINHFGGDSGLEHGLVREQVARLGVAVVTARHWAEGGRGAVDLAREVVRLCEQPSSLRYAYDDDTPLWNKLLAVATRLLHKLPLATGVFELPFDADVDALLPQASAALRLIPAAKGWVASTT